MKIIAYVISLICFVVSLCHYSEILMVLSVPIMVFITVFIHEMGHYIGCKINNNIVTSINTPLFVIKGNKANIINTLFPKCYCGFIKKHNNALAYIGGPIMSLLLILVLIYIMIKTKMVVMRWFVIIAGIAFTVNILPYKNNDMMMFCRELRKNK